MLLIKPEMITDWRKSLDAIAQRAGWKEGEIRTKALRHTYCAARLRIPAKSSTESRGMRPLSPEGIVR